MFAIVCHAFAVAAAPPLPPFERPGAANSPIAATAAPTPLFTHSMRAPDGQFFPCTRVPTALAVPGGPVRLALAECRRWAGDGCRPAALLVPPPSVPVDEGDRFICLRRSTDRGHTWSGLHSNITTMRSTNPSAVWDLHAGAVRVFFNACDPYQNASGIHSVLSTDFGISWARPVAQTVEGTTPASPLRGGVGPAHGVISTRRADGSLLMALASHLHHPEPLTPNGSHVTRTFDSWVYTSVRGGDSHWRLARADLPFIGETQLAALTDGTLMLNSRCADAGHGPGTPPKQTYSVPCHCHNRAVAVSTDGGASFGPVSFDAGLPDPNCQGSMLQLSGDTHGRVAFSNPASRRSRVNMTTRVSTDGTARHWLAPGALLSSPAAPAPPYSPAALAAYSALMHAHGSHELATLWEGGHQGCVGASCAIYISWTPIPAAAAAV
jgi:sialidase-1